MFFISDDKIHLPTSWSNIKDIHKGRCERDKITLSYLESHGCSEWYCSTELLKQGTSIVITSESLPDDICLRTGLITLTLLLEIGR